MGARGGNALVEQGTRWIAGNRDEWMELQRVCLEIEAKRDRHGRPKARSITRGGVYATCEHLGIKVSNDMTFQRDHDLWSVLARYLTELHPQLGRLIRHRECDVARHVRSHGLPELDASCVYVPRGGRR